MKNSTLWVGPSPYELWAENPTHDHYRVTIEDFQKGGPEKVSLLISVGQEPLLKALLENLEIIIKNRVRANRHYLRNWVPNPTPEQEELFLTIEQDFLIFGGWVTKILSIELVTCQPFDPTSL